MTPALARCLHCGSILKRPGSHNQCASIGKQSRDPSQKYRGMKPRQPLVIRGRNRFGFSLPTMPESTPIVANIWRNLQPKNENKPYSLQVSIYGLQMAIFLAPHHNPISAGSTSARFEDMTARFRPSSDSPC
jgi:hypothetical protein